MPRRPRRHQFGTLVEPLPHPPPRASNTQGEEVQQVNGGSAEAEGVKVGREFEPDPEPEPEPEKEPEEGEGGEEGEPEVRMQGGWMDGGG